MDGKCQTNLLRLRDTKLEFVLLFSQADTVESKREKNRVAFLSTLSMRGARLVRHQDRLSEK